MKPVQRPNKISVKNKIIAGAIFGGMGLGIAGIAFSNNGCSITNDEPKLEYGFRYHGAPAGVFCEEAWDKYLFGNEYGNKDEYFIDKNVSELTGQEKFIYRGCVVSDDSELVCVNMSGNGFYVRDLRSD